MTWASTLMSGGVGGWCRPSMQDARAICDVSFAGGTNCGTNGSCNVDTAGS